MAANTTGRLLVASPQIRDGFFDRSVVFMLHHDEMGALGVIISRPTGLEIEELLPRWAPLTLEPAVVFDGGPVEPNGFIGVARGVDGADFDDDDDAIATPVGPGDLVTVDLDADPALAATMVDRLRIFRGYSGWAPGQLEGELNRGGWFIIDADVGDLWSEDPATLYETVLRRQEGELRWFANVPDDPSLN
ncbi:MAG: YqgE/AlgH family protein [Actinomycetota bacterium]